MAIEPSCCTLCGHFCSSQELREPGYKGRVPGSPNKLFLYHRCRSCGYTWLDPESYLSKQEEKAHYDRHDNDPKDLRYRAFLNRLWEPLKKQLKPAATGIDYGSGPGPTLHLMAQEDGFPCEHYDPFYHPDKSVFKAHYDFVTCSETVEHFHNPKQEFEKMANLLKPGGWLAIMTNRLQPETDFANWHYRHDPTHVSFHTDKSIKHLAKAIGFKTCQFASKTVVLLRKP